MHGFPDFHFIESIILPRYSKGEDWLLPLLLHAKNKKICIDFYCTTCGAGPFKQALRLMWKISSEPILEQGTMVDQKIMSSMDAKKMSYKQFSLDEIEILIGGLICMDVSSILELPKDLFSQYSNLQLSEFGLLFPEPYIRNPLMLVLKMVFDRTSQISNQQYGDPHKLMQIKLSGSSIYDFFLVMYHHWQNKRR